MRILDRIIRHAIIHSTLIVSAVVIGIQSFLSLVQQFNFVGQHNFGLWQVLKYVPMQLPAQFYQLFPIAGFLGALIGLSRLSSSSQLIVMRASGVSVVHIAWSVTKAALLMIIVMTIVGEGIGPQWQLQSEQMREKALAPPKNVSILESVWLHQEGGFTHIGELTNQNKMIDVTRYHFDSDGHLSRATEAESAQLINGQWQLSHLHKTIFLHDAIQMQAQHHAHLDLAFQPDLQVEMSIISAEQTIKNLYHTIQYRRSIGLGTNQFVFSFWQRLLQPITTLVLICLAVPFVFGSFRSASIGMRILTGMLIGFIFYMLNQLFGPITLVYQFPPLLAAVTPTCLFLVIAMILLARTK